MTEHRTLLTVALLCAGLMLSPASLRATPPEDLEAPPAHIPGTFEGAPGPSNEGPLVEGLKCQPMATCNQWFAHGCVPLQGNNPHTGLPKTCGYCRSQQNPFVYVCQPHPSTSCSDRSGGIVPCGVWMTGTCTNNGVCIASPVYSTGCIRPDCYT